MSEIPNITYEYLLGAVMIKGKPNTYYGSVTTGENCGIFDDRFRYRLTLLAPEDGEKEISATYYMGWQAFDVQPPETFTEKRFSPDEDGAQQATDWLREQLNAISNQLQQ